MAPSSSNCRPVMDGIGSHQDGPCPPSPPLRDQRPRYRHSTALYGVQRCAQGTGTCTRYFGMRPRRPLPPGLLAAVNLLASRLPASWSLWFRRGLDALCRPRPLWPAIHRVALLVRPYLPSRERRLVRRQRRSNRARKLHAASTPYCGGFVDSSGSRRPRRDRRHDEIHQRRSTADWGDDF